MKILLPLLTTLAFIGCAASHYKPYYGSGEGYSETNVTRNKYDVTFHGAKNQDEISATQYALTRAAEIGKQNEFSYFRVLNAQQNETIQKIITLEKESHYVNQLPQPQDSSQSSTSESQKTKVVKWPVIKIEVEYQNKDCEDCLSVSAELLVALRQKIIRE